MKLLKGKKSGITLIEALIVFAAGVGLIAGGLTLYRNLQNTGNIKQETTNISNIVKRISEVFGEDDMTALDADDFINAGVYTSDTRIIGSDVYNVWNGKILITVTDVATYDLKYEKVPVGEPCIDLVMSTRKMGFDSIKVEGSGGMDSDVSDITASMVTTACADSGGDNSVDVSWVMEP